MLEVHDTAGRLEQCCSLLRRRGFKVMAEAQEGGEVDGYAMVVPAALRLFYVYACRRDVDGERCGRAHHRGQGV